MPPDGNCLFHAVLRAKDKKRYSTTEEVADLRNQVADRLESLLTKIQKKEQDPIYIRFAAIFEAENEVQLRNAYNDLPLGYLREEAMQLTDKNFTSHHKNIEKEEMEEID